MEIIDINAAGKKVGRLASEIAGSLQGKRRPGFRPYNAGSVKVVVTNTDKILFTGQKLLQKIYYRHTGTIGHLRKIPLARRFASDSRLVLRTAVNGMLPKNRLRKEFLKNLVMYKSERA